MYNCKYSKQVQVIFMCCIGTIKCTIRQKVLPTGILCYTYFTWCNLSLLLYLNIFTYCHHNSVPWVHTYGRYTPLSPFLDTIYLLTAPNLCAASTFIAHLFHDPFILNKIFLSHLLRIDKTTIYLLSASSLLFCCIIWQGPVPWPSAIKTGRHAAWFLENFWHWLLSAFLF